MSVKNGALKKKRIRWVQLHNSSLEFENNIFQSTVLAVSYEKKFRH